MLFQVPPSTPSYRLDLFLRDQLSGFSRSRIQELIRGGSVRVNQRFRRSSYVVQGGDVVVVEVPQAEPLRVEAEAIALDVPYEDSAMLVVNKPAGMTVHPAPGSWTGTLVNALLHHCQDLSGINGVLRPGIVHRLDKDTSGLLAVAKSDAAHRGLAAQLESRQMHRRYLALVWGHIATQGCVDAPIGRHPRDRKRMAVVASGRHAVTHYRVRQRYHFCTLLDVQLETGRTHQIRVHLQHLGHPIFGDPTYGGRNHVDGIRPQYRARARLMLDGLQRQALHAWALGFSHPISGEPMVVEAPLPQDLEQVLALADTQDQAGRAHSPR